MSNMENRNPLPMGPHFFKCLRCNDFVYCKPGGHMKWCKDECVGIDHTDLYTRFLGNGVMVNTYDEDKKLIEKYIPRIEKYLLDF